MEESGEAILTLTQYHTESGTDDEFDEIGKRGVPRLKLEMEREVPGSSPRPASRSPRPASSSPRPASRSPTVCSEDEDCGLRPVGQRLGPVGQDQEAGLQELQDQACMSERVARMEEEQEELSSSLMALTSHYAKVQLRLQQIVSAPTERREDLLKDLEQFAFRGVPDIRQCGLAAGSAGVEEEQSRRQRLAIEQLKQQLEELESYAYQSGESAPPSALLLDRQRLVMEQLRDRLNLNVEDIGRLTEEQLRATVDSAVGEIVNPLKMKSQLVSQLQTQETHYTIHGLEALPSSIFLCIPNAGCLSASLVINVNISFLRSLTWRCSSSSCRRRAA